VETKSFPSLAKEGLRGDLIKVLDQEILKNINGVIDDIPKYL